ncbi:MAG: hypothetical protein IKB60_00580 [Clostridia bacterium]|nr:hypothetical protein [Clostridia bacterium]
MAEFCFKCFNRINGTNHKKEDYIMSDDLDLCEGCGQWKHVVVMDRRSYELGKYQNISSSLRIQHEIFCWALKLYALPFTLPYYIHKRRKSKNKKNLKHF